ncbi:MAG: FkbM family methyltransferase [Bauldia sp.]
MDRLSLYLADGTVLVLPRSLESFTTYVLLEQEAWFEKETQFLAAWLKPGMNVIDIGANVGVYAVPMARRVAPGRVVAFEPGSDPRSFLSASREANALVNLDILGKAVSDKEGEARLSFGGSSELASLGGSGPGEMVTVTTLDGEDAGGTLPPPDFVKIDAEGEEQRILAGAETFLDKHAPLLMLEVKAGAAVDRRPIDALRARGYGVFRALPLAPLLLPVEPDEPLDDFELNLFAAKPSRAAQLHADGFLVFSLGTWSPERVDAEASSRFLNAQPCAKAFASAFARPLDSRFRDALAGYVAWRDDKRDLTERASALLHSWRSLHALCQGPASIARLMTCARVALEAGQRAHAVHALHRFKRQAELNPSPNEAFLQPNPDFDAVAVGAHTSDWLLAAALELLERISSFSSLYGSPGFDHERFAGKTAVSPEMDRRRVMVGARAGRRVPVPERLKKAQPGHINAEIWRNGLVPGTVV